MGEKLGLNGQAGDLPPLDRFAEIDVFQCMTMAASRLAWPCGSAGPRSRARRGHAGHAKTRPAGKVRPRCLRQGDIARQAAQTVRRTAAATLPHECHGHVFHQRSHQALLSLKTNRPSHTRSVSFPLAYDPAPYRNRPGLPGHGLEVELVCHLEGNSILLGAVDRLFFGVGCSCCLLH